MKALGTKWIVGSVILLSTLGVILPVGGEPAPFEAPTSYTAIIPLMDIEGLKQDNARVAASQPKYSPDSALAQAAGAPVDLDALAGATGLAFGESVTPLEIGHFHAALTTAMALGAIARDERMEARKFSSTALDLIGSLGYPAALVEKLKRLADDGEYAKFIEVLTQAVSNRSPALMVPWTLGTFCGVTISGVIYELSPMVRMGRNSLKETLGILDADDLKTPFAALAQDLVRLTEGKTIDGAEILQALKKRYKAMGLPG